jgi:hypothetical protein
LAAAPPPSDVVPSFAAFLGEVPAAARPVFADLDNSEQPEQHRRAVIDGDWKLIERRNGNRLLFDLGRDVGEQTDVAATAAVRTETLAAALSSHQAESVSRRVMAAPATVVLSPEDKARMRALGYEP